MIPLNLLPTDIRRVENVVSHWFKELPRGVTAEQALDPDLWQNLGRKFSVNDTITVVAADGSFDFDLRVIEIDPRDTPLWVRTRVLRSWIEGEASAGYREPESMRALGAARGIQNKRRSLLEADPKPRSTGRDPVELGGYQLKWSGFQKWRIIDRAGNVIEKLIPTREDGLVRLEKLAAERPESAQQAA